MIDQTLVLLGGAHVHLPDHLEHIKKRGWRISHVFDRDTERRDELCKSLEAEPADPEKLADLGCRGAVVCSETVFHEEDILNALEAGLHVFTEKPLAGSAQAAERCARKAESLGLTLHTGYFFRTNDALRHLQAMLRADAFGAIVDVRMRFSHDGGYADWLNLDCWMTDPALACYGGFADEAVHVIDALQWLIRPIHSAHAVTGNALGWQVDDHGAGLLKFENGATGVIEAGWTDSEMRLEIDLTGETGWARLRAGKLEIGRRGTEAPEDVIPLPPLDAGEGIEPFLDRLEGADAPALVPPFYAVRVNQVLDEMGVRLPQ